MTTSTGNIGPWQPIPISEHGNQYQYRTTGNQYMYQTMATNTNIGRWQPVPISDYGNQYQYRTTAIGTNIGLWQPVLILDYGNQYHWILDYGNQYHWISDYGNQYQWHIGQLQSWHIFQMWHRSPPVRPVGYILMAHRTILVQHVLITATQDCSSAFRNYYCHIGLF